MTKDIDEIENFIVDTGSPVTIVPPARDIMKNKKMSPTTRRYHNVDKKRSEIDRKDYGRSRE